MMMIITCFCF